MPDYQFGKIYKITGINEEGIELTYIGSTYLSLIDRFKYHKNLLINNCSSKIIIKTCSNIMITLIIDFPCKTRKELLIKERYYYDIYECINIKKPILLEGEQKQYNINYRINNADKIKQNNIQYNINNTDKKKQNNIQYYIDNAENLKQNNIQYYIDNAEKLKQQRLKKIDIKKEYDKQYRLKKLNLKNGIID